MLLLVWFEWAMLRADTSASPYKPSSRVATGGPFRYTRNPGYLALTPILGDIRGVATEPRREAARRG